MTKRHVALLTATSLAAALAAACAPDRPGPVEIQVPLYSNAGGGDRGVSTSERTKTHMHGEEEVFVPATPGAPTPADSKGEGHASFLISPDGHSVEFRLAASNIDNIIMSHIHCGRPGSNGPIRMWLYPVIGPTGAQAPNGGGRFDGQLASGTFDPTGVVCPASAVGHDMPLLDAIRAGLTYVNVHTNDGVAPTNTGPGDFPGGEIRGQLPGAEEIGH